MPAESSSSMQQVVDTALSLFQGQFGSSAQRHIGWSPGRINLIGEYTDFNQGFVMPMAIDLGICVILRLTDQPNIRVYSAKYDELQEFSLPNTDPSELTSWAKYIHGVATLSQMQGCDIPGFDAVIHSNMSSNGGVSSSAALCMATTMAIQSAANWSLSPLDAARLCQSVEHQFVNVKCGIMDQMACRLGQPDSALFIDCESLAFDTVPMPSQQAEILLVDSGVTRSLYESEYNLRRIECENAVRAIAQLGHSITNLRRVDIELLQRVENDLPAKLHQRARHVVTENQRVLRTQKALRKGDLAELGNLMYDSHRSLQKDFEVSVAELDQIVESAKACTGVFGARLTGAGFGGNAIVLLEPSVAIKAQQTIVADFTKRFQRSPSVHRISRSTSAQGYPIQTN